MSLEHENLHVPTHEEVVRFIDRDRGLEAVIAVHSTALGPALGGTRFYPFPSFDVALTDVLRLSEAMTFKNAVAGLDHGGGKAVILGDPRSARSPELLHAYGEAVCLLEGRYITTEDVGTTPADMDAVLDVCPHVTGASTGSGDPSVATAHGVHRTQEAVAQRLFGGEGLRGRHVVVSGVGKVGTLLVEHLVGAGARVTVADVRADATAALAQRFKGSVAAVEPDDALTTACDILAPCALGGVLSAETVASLRCRAVVGAANNQLTDDAVAEQLRDAGILYVPDFVVNAGGVINLARETGAYSPEDAPARIDAIADTVVSILDEAEHRGVTPLTAALDHARRRIAAAG